jgi:hypothetical protein
MLPLPRSSSYLIYAIEGRTAYVQGTSKDTGASVKHPELDYLPITYPDKIFYEYSESNLITLKQGGMISGVELKPLHSNFLNLEYVDGR